MNMEATSKIREYLKKEGLIFPKAPVKEFYSQIFKLSGFGIGGLLKFSGKKAGIIAAQILEEVLKSEKDLETICKYVKILLEETGVCNIECIDIEENKIKLSVKNSIFAEGISQSKKPVCR